MNKINRALVKAQAKQFIKGKVFYLFLISFIVSLLTGTVSTVIESVTNYDDFDDLNSYYSDDNYDYGYFDDYDSDTDNPIDSFDYNSANSDYSISNLSSVPDSDIALSVTAGLSFIISLIFIPLTVTLAGMYVSLIRRNANEKFNLGTELGGIFKNSFNQTYGKKLLVVILTSIIGLLLCCLFIVPGIIFFYSAYFANQIMNDYPNLKPSEAIKLSKKIIKGNRSELFVYDLSFIPWYLLSAVTFGIANIYVIPYKSTSDALYYENFRLRALAEGRVTEDDFLSEQERINKYNSAAYNNAYQQNTYYTTDAGAQNAGYQPYSAPNADAQGYQPYNTNVPPVQRTVNNDGTFYSPDFRPVQQFNPYTDPAQQNGGFYNPPQYQQPTEPSGTQYYNPTAQQPNYNPSYQPQEQTYNPTAAPEQEQYYTPPQEQPSEPTEPQYYNPTEETDTEQDYNIPPQE